MGKKVVQDPPFDVPASEVFGKEIVKKQENIVDSTLDWLLGNDIATELPPPPKNNSTFRRALAEVRFGITTEKGKYAGFVCNDGADAYFPAEPYDSTKNVKRLRFVPIRTIRRNTVWRNNRPLYEDPQNYGPPIDVIVNKESDQVKDTIRIVYYDIDKEGIYQMDLSSQASRREAELFDYFLRLQAKGDSENKPTPAFAHLYFAMAHGDRNKKTKQMFYNLRILRRNDTVTAGELDISNDVTTLPQYQRVELSTDREFEKHLTKIRELLAPGTKSAAAVKMATLTGLQANSTIRAIDEGKISLEEVLRVVPEVYVAADSKPTGSGLS